jgi:hypothetical protein
MRKLWIVGCSITHGVGVDKDQSWGILVSNYLKLPSTFLTAQGSSIEWATNQILQSDIKSDDIVLWGLTSPSRYMYYADDGSLQHILNVYYKSNPHFEKIISNQRLVDNNLAFKAVNYVKQVQNFLDKIDCQYLIGYMLPGIDDHKQILLDNLSTTKSFFVAAEFDKINNADKNIFLKQIIPNTDMFVDVGTDKIHPGPKQHQLYAEQFIFNLQNLC